MSEILDIIFDYHKKLHENSTLYNPNLVKIYLNTYLEKNVTRFVQNHLYKTEYWNITDLHVEKIINYVLSFDDISIFITDIQEVTKSIINLKNYPNSDNLNAFIEFARTDEQKIMLKLKFGNQI